jgi:bifunctional non-homologous end joining protein LigD
MSTSTLVKIGKRQVALSNLNKVLYPDAGFTKADVIAYYRAIAPVLLPHLEDRPLTLKRYPNGVDDKFFYEKRCPSHKPEWVETAKVWSESNDEHMFFCLANDVPTLVWVANLASIELHTFLSKRPDVTRPTSFVLDLDPGPPATILDCIPVALRLRELLDKLKLQCLVKTSGGKGLHIWVPLNTEVTFERTKEFARLVAITLERHDPKHVTSNMRKDLRPGKIFIDWSQNDEHKTTVSVYSLRARQRPTVSTPLTWKEIESASRHRNPAKLTFEAKDALKRVEKLGDLFEPVLRMKQRLPAF